MKRILSLTLSVLLLVAVLPVSAYAASQEPRIIETVYPTEDIVIADIVATEAPYNADATGENDVSAVLQNALNDCASNGGGTVFLPVGRYRLCSPIYIPKFVTLRGDHQDADIGTEYGTLLIADVESSNAMTPGLITVGGSAGAVGLTVWYPEQTLDEVKPYPYTFYVVGNGDYMLQTIRDITLINSYRGIGASSECENNVYQCHEMLTVENVKGTCLYEGLNSYNSADVDTHKTLYILNKYWLEAGEAFNAPDLEALNAYTRANATGLVLGDLEWPQFANIRVSDMKYGIRSKVGPRARLSGVFCDLYIKDCDYGMYADEGAIFVWGKDWGISVCGGEIEGSEYAIVDPDDGALWLNDVAVKGKIIGKNIRRYNADLASYLPTYDKTYQKPAAVLYTVNADRTGRTDASTAVQAALDNAATTGGVVYLPGGLYRFDGPISIPAGVELRGSSSVPTRDQGGNSSGTLILSYYGYDPALSPLVTLAGDNAGLNGIRIDFPLNNPVDDSGKYDRTVPAVYSKADNVYLTNCFLTLASVGVRFEGVKNAYLKKVVGCCYESMYYFSDCDNAYIEGCLQNANALPRNGYSSLGIPELADRLTEDHLFDYVFIPITRVYTDYIRLERCTGAYIFNTFIYGGKTFLNATDSNVVVVNIGSDGSSKTAPTLDLTGGDLTILNSMRSTSDGQLCYRYFETKQKASLRSYGGLAPAMQYRDRPVLKNIACAELREGETIYLILQPFYTIEKLFGKLMMDIKQK
ncbi:MAG: hypothetical protein IJK23_00910 [Clostridia bacterium]|nr:hypothetical protein [Clostridia bacterium]